jgi:hypothetical protein
MCVRVRGVFVCFTDEERGVLYSNPKYTKNATLPKGIEKETSRSKPWVELLGRVTTILLAVDYLIRMIVCPSLKEFLSELNIICDGIAVVSAVVKEISDIYPQLQKSSGIDRQNWVDAIAIMQLFRVFRIVGLFSQVSLKKMKSPEPFLFPGNPSNFKF